jgi:sulfite exporter TauE/SafE
MSAWITMLALAALTSGLMGGVHCSAMCGAMTGLVRGTATPWRNVLAAHGGRLASYACAGALAGSLGQAGLTLHSTLRAQQAVLLASGVTLLVTALAAMRAGVAVRHLEAAGALVWRGLSPAMRHVVPADNVPKAALVGVLWGWLPCGMVYAALLLALTAGSGASGAMVMLAFGAGTLPALLLTHAVAWRLRVAMGLRGARVAAGLCMAGAGLWLIIHAVHPGWPQAFLLFCGISGG